MTLDDVRGRATLSVGEAAELLGISKPTCFEAIRRAEIPSLRLGARRILVPVPALLRLIGEQQADEPISRPPPKGDD